MTLASPIAQRVTIASGILIALSSALIATDVAPAGKLQYNRDVRPILSEKCFACHGFDKSKTRRQSASRHARRSTGGNRFGRTSDPPKDAAASELVRRILSEDHDERMPPPESGKELTAEQKAILQKWIDEGAEYEAHWAFAAPKKVAVPQVDGESAKNPIDAFVRARLQSENLPPSQPADAITLIRRSV